MKIFAISDLHLSSDDSKPMDVFGASWAGYWEKIKEDWQARVSDEDIVLIAGDISWAMRLEDATLDFERIAALNGTKIITRGNHDYWWAGISKLRASLPPSIMCIQNDAVKIGDTVICGTRGWTVPDSMDKPTAEDIKLYEREKVRLTLTLREGAKLRGEGDKLIVMLHYPPFNVHLEDSDYTKLIAESKADAVVYGHLHGATSRACMVCDKRGIPYYLTSCDMLNNKLLELELK